MELPPRARRILQPTKPTTQNFGTTSACAENTDLVAIVGGAVGNYLRVRGEYHCAKLVRRMPRELPPRARRILVVISW